MVRTDIFRLVLTTTDEIGYYTFTAEALDKAGNPSAEIERTIVHDNVIRPDVGISVLTAGDIDGPFDVTVLMADNLSLRDAAGNAVYGDDAYTIRLVAAPIDDFDADPTDDRAASCHCRISSPCSGYMEWKHGGDVTYLASDSDDYRQHYRERYSGDRYFGPP